MLARFYSSSGDAQATTRCVVPARLLPAQVVLAGQVEIQPGLPSVWQNPVSAHIFDIVRDREQARNRIVIDVDDPYHEGGPGWNERDVESHLDALKHADCVICTTEPLAESYREHHHDVRVIPSCVDLQDFQFGRQTQHLDGKLRIGYAAGYTHAPDAALLAEPLAEIAKRDDVIIEFVGAFDPGWDFPYNRYPALPYAAYKAMIATWAIGLAPLADTPLNATRSDLKALDYGMSFAVPVASPVGPYAQLADYSPLSTAADAAEWVEVLETLIDKDELRSQIAMAFYTYCRIERHPANQRVAYLDALGLTRSHAHA